MPKEAGRVFHHQYFCIFILSYNIVLFEGISECLMSEALTSCGVGGFRPGRNALKSKIISVKQLHLAELRLSKCPKSHSKVLSGAFSSREKTQ